MAKVKQPYIPIYVGDYIKDTKILPLNVRGGWIDIILNCWENNGESIGTIEEYARMMSCDPAEAKVVIDTLIKRDICNHKILKDGRIKIVSRKIKRMIELSEMRKGNGKKGGNMKLKENYTSAGFVYAMEREDGAIKIGISKNPKIRIYKIREQYPGKKIEILDYFFVENMGGEEVIIHEKFASKKDGEWFSLDSYERETLLNYIASKKQANNQANIKQNPEDENEDEVETNSHSVFALRLLSKEGELDKEAVEISTKVTVTMQLLSEFHANLKNSNVTHHHFSEYKKHLVNWIPKKPKEKIHVNGTSKVQSILSVNKEVNDYFDGTND